MNDAEETPKRKVGRPRLTYKGYTIARPLKQMRAYDEEWAMIKAFAKVVKKDPERAAKILSQHKIKADEKAL